MTLKIEITESKLKNEIYPKIKNILKQKEKDKYTKYVSNDGKKIDFTKEALEKGHEILDSLSNNGVNYDDALVFCFIFSPDFHNIQEQNKKGVINLNKHIENAIERNIWNEGSSLYMVFKLFSNKYFESLQKDLSNPKIIYEIFNLNKEKKQNV